MTVMVEHNVASIVVEGPLERASSSGGMMEVASLGHEAWGLLHCVSTWSAGRKTFLAMFVYLVACLMWVGDYFRDLQSALFDPFFS